MYICSLDRGARQRTDVCIGRCFAIDCTKKWGNPTHPNQIEMGWDLDSLSL